MKKPLSCSVLGLDIGKKRVGLAGCDPLGITITRIPALIRTSIKKDIEILRNHCLTREVKGLIIGLPLDNNCNETNQSIYCKKYGTRIGLELDLPIAWVNEHSSTWEATQKYKLKKDRSGIIDSAVAALLIEQWLNEGPELKTYD